MINYVCGFIFTTDLSKVTLIKKIKPEWQKDKLNGIGGKIEPKEYPEQAMIRECKEETDIDLKEWQFFHAEDGNDWRCFFFYSITDAVPKTVEVEEVAQYNVSDIGTLSVIPNLKYIIPNALDAIKTNKFN